MVIYLLGFAISVLLIAIAEKRKTKYFILLSAGALLIPCLIAGLRGISVGTDTTVYLKPLTQAAIGADNIGEFFRTYWFDSWRNKYVQDFDLGFCLLVYFSGKLIPSMAGVQFFISAFILVPVYAALAAYRKRYPIWLGMLIFYLYFFNSTMNLMRQWVAMAFLLLAFRYLIEKKWGRVACLSVVAVLFHGSALITVVIFLMYGCLCVARRWRFVQNDIQLSGELMLVFLITMVSFVAILNLDLVIKLMEVVGVGAYSNYLKGKPMRLMINQIILRLPVIALFALNWKDFRRATPRAPFYLGMLLLDVVVSQLISVDVYAFRIGYFFSVYLVLAVPVLYSSIPCRIRRTATTVLLVSYCLFMWYYNHVLQLRHETYPYTFLF